MKFGQNRGDMYDSSDGFSTITLKKLILNQIVVRWLDFKKYILAADKQHLIILIYHLPIKKDTVSTFIFILSREYKFS
jgi:hypothetical protein